MRQRQGWDTRVEEQVPSSLCAGICSPELPRFITGRSALQSKTCEAYETLDDPDFTYLLYADIDYDRHLLKMTPKPGLNTMPHVKVCRSPLDGQTHFRSSNFLPKYLGRDTSLGCCLPLVSYARLFCTLSQVPLPHPRKHSFFSYTSSQNCCCRNK